MTHPVTPGGRVRVGEFEIDLESGELVGRGTRVRLQGQSLELLKALLERPGLLVHRDELRQRLWPDDTFVDFDHGLNAAVRRLREALADSADAPRFIETIPRKGYRLIAPIEGDWLAAAPSADGDATRVEPDPPAAVPGWRPYMWALGACVLIGSGLMVWAWPGRTPPSARAPLATFHVDMPAGCFMNRLSAPAISPDSRYIAFTACDSLWVRSLAAAEARRLPIDATAYSAPFWSDDSRFIGFFADRQLRTISVEGERLQVLAAAPPFEAGGTWMSSGDILFTPMVTRGVQRLVTTGGATEAVTSLDVNGRREHSHMWPHAISGTDRFTFVARPSPSLELRGRIGRIGSSQVLDLGPTDSHVVPTSSGHLLWVHNGVLVAQALNGARTGLVGRPTAIAHDVAVRVPIWGQFSASAELVAYLSRDDAMAWTTLTVFDRSGAVVETVGEAAEYCCPRVSPDGTRLAVGLRDPRTGTRDIWVYGLTGAPPLRLTLDRQDDTSPVWSADGQQILFTSDREGERDLYQRDAAAQHPEVRVFASDESKSLNAWSPDGRFAIYDTGARGSVDAEGRANQADLHTVVLGRTPRVLPLATTHAQESMADISPDGTLVAYHAAEPRQRPEIYVETFPEKGGRWQVSASGGVEPTWRADGRELFFRTTEGIFGVDVHRDANGVRFGSPRVLFTPVPKVHWSTRMYAPFPDGQRFVVVAEARRPAVQKLTVIVNWRSALRDD